MRHNALRITTQKFEEMISARFLFFGNLFRALGLAAHLINLLF